MLELNIRKNQNNGPEVGIRTNEGELIVSKENGNLYFGYFNKNEELQETKEFIISKKDNEEIYERFFDLYEGLNTDKNINEVTFVSDEADIIDDEEESKITFIKDPNEDRIIIVLTKSKSKNIYNTFFVEFEDIDIPIESHYYYLIEFLDGLLTYDPQKPNYGQISIYDLTEEDLGISRKRTTSSRVNL